MMMKTIFFTASHEDDDGDDDDGDDDDGDDDDDDDDDGDGCRQLLPSSVGQ